MLLRRTPGNVTYVQQWFFGLVSILAPLFWRKKPGLVVCTSFHGDAFTGNTAVMFAQLQSHPSLNIRWLTRNRRLKVRLEEEFGANKVALIHSWEGVRLLTQAKAVLLTHGTSDYAFMRLPKNAAIIQTYHGLPTKKGEYWRVDGKSPGLLHRLALCYRFRKITHFLSTSPMVSALFAKRFNLTQNQIVETGFPYLNVLVSRPKTLDYVVKNFGQPPGCRMILYAPTYRVRRRTKWFPFPDMDFERLNIWLEKQNAVLALRTHPNEKAALHDVLRLSQRCVLAGSDIEPDVTRLLAHCAGVVTDYSSIYLEGLLLDLPVVFLPYDLQVYERGQPVPYDAVTPGPKPGTFEAFLSSLEALLSGAPAYASERERVRGMYFSDMQGKAVQRVTHLLENLVFAK